MRDLAFEFEHRAVRRSRQGLQRSLLLGKGFIHHAMRGRMDSRIGDSIEPAPQLLLEIVEVAERAAEKKSSRL